MTKKQVINYCLTFPEVYEDYPFDENWAAMRMNKNKKSFAFVFSWKGHICINVKCDTEWAAVWRETYKGVIPAYHMNKKHWNTIILDGSVPGKEVKRMIRESYDLVK